MKTSDQELLASTEKKTLHLTVRAVGKVDVVRLVLRAASKAQYRGCQSDHGNNVST